MSYQIAAVPVRKVRGKKVVVYPTTPVGLGLSISDFNPITLATKIQAGADKIQSNIQTGTSWLQKEVTSVTDVANRVGAGVQGAAQGGIAAGATGNAGTGLTLAALTQSPVLIAGGLALVYFVFLRHPGKRGW